MAEFSVNNEGQATDSEAETPLLSVLEDESASQVLNSDAKYLLRACKMDVNEVAIRSYVTPDFSSKRAGGDNYIRRDLTPVSFGLTIYLLSSSITVTY